MEIKLNVLERITLLNLLPKEENYITLRMLTELKRELSFLDSEIKEYGIEFLPDGRVTWKNGVKTKKIDLPDTIRAMVVEKLKDLDKNKKINEENVTLYEKIILDKKE